MIEGAKFSIAFRVLDAWVVRYRNNIAVGHEVC